MDDHITSERILFRLNYMLKRLMDRYAGRNLNSILSEGFNVTFLPYFMSIGDEGISNHDLVKKILVTKQGVSKTVKELENLGLVYTEKSETDARSIMIYLTDAGKSLYSNIKQQADHIKNDYIKNVGLKNYETTVDTLMKIIKFHEELERKEV